MFVFSLPGTLDSLDDLTPLLWDAGAQGLEEGQREGQAVVLAYFAEQVDLAGIADLGITGTWNAVADEDWQEQFRASIEAVRIGRIVVAPSWQTAVLEPTDILIELDPGLAFGTGQHETTRLAIEALLRHDLHHKRVLDVGTGSGILAIVAAKLGASYVYGLDNDASTVPVAQENASNNQLPAPTQELRFVHGTLDRIFLTVASQFDVIVANLFAELHQQLLPLYKRCAKPGSSIIMTGILASSEQADAGESQQQYSPNGRENLVIEAIKRAGLELVRREQAGDWVLLEATV
jgi:ribosomal protein L11 methyltransferase